MTSLLDRLEGVRQAGPDRWLARCPAHDDRSPSLSVRDVGDKLLLHCFSGCEPLDIVHAVGLELSDLFADAKPPGEGVHRHRPSKRRIPAADILAAIDHDALTVAVVGADMLERKSIDAETWKLLASAVQRIGAARDLRR